MPWPHSGDLPDPGIQPVSPVSPALQADSLLLSHLGSPSLYKPKPIYIYIYASKSEGRSAMSDSLRPHGLYSAWNSPGQNTGVGRHSLLQGIFPIQVSNPCLLHCRWILYQLSHQGTPRILEWVDYPFSSGYSQPRNQIGVSCIVGRFFIS